MRTDAVMGSGYAIKALDESSWRQGVATAALTGALDLIAGLGGGKVEGYPGSLGRHSRTPGHEMSRPPGHEAIPHGSGKERLPRCASPRLTAARRSWRQRATCGSDRSQLTLAISPTPPTSNDGIALLRASRGDCIFGADVQRRRLS